MTTTAQRRVIKPHHSIVPTRNFFIISMAAFLFLCLLALHFLSLPSTSSSADSRHHRTFPRQPLTPTSDGAASPAVQQACKATRFRELCASTLSQSPGSGSDPSQILNAAISVSADNLKTSQDMVKRILDSSTGNPNRSTAARNCLEVLSNSAYRTQSAVDALPRGKTKDARAWLSAALLFQYDCWSGLKYANDTSLVNETMAFLNSLTMLTSNALGMLVSYDLHGNDTGSWRPPATERDGFWEPGSVSGTGKDFTATFPPNLAADATVCKDGAGGCYGKVQDAVDAAPSNGAGRFVIRIMEGIYEETVRVPLDKKNVVFVGDGVGKTVITGSLNVGQPGIWTYNTATVAVLGDGFMATGVTFENTAGPDAHQAVAFRSDSDLTYIENCEFLGNQDTLYAHSLRQYYKSCQIEGNVDFIFGNSAAFFQDCQILVRPRQLKPEKGEKNAVTAQGRTDPSQSTGFVFQNCAINGTEEYMNLYHQKPAVHRNFLGRPWKEYSRTVFINCNIEALVSPPGWMPWKGNFALKMLYYGEFKNSGAGSVTSQRVPWSSQIPAEHAEYYSVRRFIQGDEWIPTSS